MSATRDLSPTNERASHAGAAIFGQLNFRFIKLFPIPKLAGHLSMRLIKRFTIIRIGAAANFITTTELHFDKPIRIGQSLSRQTGNVRLTALKN